MMLLIRKSQMNLFDHHEEQRTVHAGTRHLQNGAVVQVAEHQRRTEVADTVIPKIYSTPVVTREKVSAMVNEFLAPMGITFEYGKSVELRGKHGWAFPKDRRIITRKDATIDDLAHEIAHIVQYDMRGDTRCSSDRNQGELGSEHTNMTKEYVEKLKQNKLGYLFQKANGITWRTMNQDIGTDLDPRIAQADREYAEWQTQQATKKLYHAGADVPTDQLNSDTYWTHDKEVAEKGYLNSRPEVSKLHEAEFHGDKPAGDDVVISTAKSLGFDEDDLEGYTPASAFDKQLFPAHLVDKLKAELSRQGYSHIEATDITPPGRYQKEFKAIIPLVPVKHLAKSLSLTHLLRKSHRDHHTAYERHIASGTVVEIKQKGAAPSEPHAGQSIKAPNGTYDFGEITAEVAQQIGKFPAKIRLLHGEHSALHKGTGLTHIKTEHGSQIKAAGFASPEDFVQYVATNYNAVYKAKKGRLALVVEGPPQQVAIIEVRKNKKGGFYSVCTAYPPKNIKFTGTALWRGRQPSQSDSGDQQPLPMIPKDHPVVVAKSLNHPTSTSGQSASDKTNISKPSREINKSLAGGYLLKSAGLAGRGTVGNFNTLAFVADINKRDISVGTERDFIGNLEFTAAYTANAIDVDHNNLQNQNRPSAYIKPAQQNDIRHIPLLKAAKTLHGRIDFNGLQISIETGRSRSRTWKNPHDGSMGISRMEYSYGYIKRTLGVDNDHFDCFVGPDTTAPTVYIVTTMEAPDFTEIDEQKAIVGCPSVEEAKRIFHASYSDPRFFGTMTEMPFEEFKQQVLATKNDPKLLSGEMV